MNRTLLSMLIVAALGATPAWGQAGAGNPSTSPATETPSGGSTATAPQPAGPGGGYGPGGRGMMGPGMMGPGMMGPGMMGGPHGPGMMGGGSGPGMMGGGYGPGMGGGYGAAMMGDCPHGMMGGYGSGPGMMGGGRGWGPGMMGGWADRTGPGGPGWGGRPGWGGGPGIGWGGHRAMLAALDLTDDQQGKVQKIFDDLRKRDWETAGKMMDERAKLRDLYAAPTFDRNAIAAAYKRIGDLRQQMTEARLDAHAAVEQVLTPAQRDRLRQQWRQMGRRMFAQ